MPGTSQYFRKGFFPKFLSFKLSTNRLLFGTARLADLINMQSGPEEMLLGGLERSPFATSKVLILAPVVVVAKYIQKVQRLFGPRLLIFCQVLKTTQRGQGEVGDC